MSNWLARGSTSRIAAVITLADPVVTEALAASPVDFLIVDMEHAPISDRELEPILIAARSAHKPVLVRVFDNHPAPIKRVLDTGPDGIIVPNVSTPDAARAAVTAALYPPAGRRGFGPRRAGGYGREGLGFIQRSNEQLLVVVQIEDVAAVRLADAIIRVPGVGGVMIGPNDLSGSMGLTGQVDHPRALENVGAVIRKCHESNLPVGCGGYFGGAANALIAMGVDFITAGGDIWLMIQQLEENIAELKQTVESPSETP